MKTLTFDKNSWHFLIATKIAGYTAPFEYTYNDGTTAVHGDPGDICTYSKHVMGGMFLLTLSGLAIAGASWVVVHMLLGVWFSLMLGTFFVSEVGIAGFIVTILAGIIVGVKWRSDRKMSTEYRNRLVKPDGFVKHAYKSWKEKFCLSINFVDTSK